jgi:hypothetical protein
MEIQYELPQPSRHGRNDHRHGGQHGASGDQARKNSKELQLERSGQDIRECDQDGCKYTESRLVDSWTRAEGKIADLETQT